MWIDAHCHLADSRFTDQELVGVLSRSRAQGIEMWIQGGVEPMDWRRQLYLARQIDPGIIPCFGVHPEWVSRHSLGQVKEALSQLSLMVDQAAGVGELGLDFRKIFRDQKELQVYALEEQLQLVRALKKPLVIHCVHAHAVMLDYLKKWGPFPVGGIVHSFSGAVEIAREYIKLGLLISFSSEVLRDRSEKLKKAIIALPEEGIVIETDSPDQAIGTALNEPANLIKLAQEVGRLKDVSPESVLEGSAQRLKRLFKLNQF